MQIIKRRSSRSLKGVRSFPWMAIVLQIVVMATVLMVEQEWSGSLMKQQTSRPTAGMGRCWHASACSHASTCICLRICLFVGVCVRACVCVRVFECLYVFVYVYCMYLCLLCNVCVHALHVRLSILDPLRESGSFVYGSSIISFPRASFHPTNSSQLSLELDDLRLKQSNHILVGPIMRLLSPTKNSR